MAASVLNRELNCRFFAFHQSEIGAKTINRGKEQDEKDESLLPAAGI